MNGIPLYWIIHIPIPVDTLPGHLILLLGTNPRIDECGNIHNRAIHTLSILSDTPTNSTQKHDQQPRTIDYNKLKLYFGWVNAETTKKTFENSTQWTVTSTRFPMRKHFRS